MIAIVKVSGINKHIFQKYIGQSGMVGLCQLSPVSQKIELSWTQQQLGSHTKPEQLRE